MTRLLAAFRVDALNQWRNQLYTIGMGVGCLCAVMLAWLVPTNYMGQVAPAVALALVGGSTLMYVGAMILFERDEGTLAANAVSPLRPVEYLWSKIATLTLLSTLESLVMLVGAMMIRSFFHAETDLNIGTLLLGLVVMAVVYVQAGIILVVRYRSLNDFLLPMALVAIVGQLPILYFVDAYPSPLLLWVPTSPSAMLIRGGFTPLTTTETAYGVCCSLLVIAGLAWWAHSAFREHAYRKGGIV